MKNNFLKKIFTKLAASVLAAGILFGSASAATAQPVQAANVCTSVWGSNSGSKTFEVRTDSGWFNTQYLTLTQTKGTAYSGNYAFGTNKTYKVYGAYQVTIKRTKGSGTVPKSFVWKDGSQKIKLGKNSTYKITITPLKSSFYYNSWLNFLKYDNYDKNWKMRPQWSIKKTKHVTFCA